MEGESPNHRHPPKSGLSPSEVGRVFNWHSGNYNPGQKSSGYLTKFQLATRYFLKWKVIIQCWNSRSTLDESTTMLCWGWGG